MVKVIVASHDALHSSLSLGLELSPLVLLQVLIIDILEVVHRVKFLICLGEPDDKLGIFLVLEACPVVLLNGVLGVEVDVLSGASALALLALLLGVLLRLG